MLPRRRLMPLRLPDMRSTTRERRKPITSMSGLLLTTARLFWRTRNTGISARIPSRLPAISLSGLSSSWSDGGLFAPLNFVKKYEKKDGTEQEWLMSGGDDLLKKYSELDPRFAQTIAYQGAVWNDEIGKLDFLEGGAHQVAYDKTRHLVRKWVPRTLKATYPHNSVNMDWIVFRMAELYLNYAEAVNEFQGPTAEAVAAVSKVRNRSGMLKHSLPLSPRVSSGRNSEMKELSSWLMRTTGSGISAGG